MIRLPWTLIALATLSFAHATLAAQPPPPLELWQGKQVRGSLILPTGDERAATLAQTTISHYLREFFEVEIPVAKDARQPGIYIVFGTPKNNPLIRRLVKNGVTLTRSNLGEEGFQIVSCEDGASKFIILYGKTASALKYACQELIFHHTQVTAGKGGVDWPLDVMMKPEFDYRGTYMLPCWLSHDSLALWQRMLQFNSELTLNRNWFWLDGFPVAGHPGPYGYSDLANETNVQALIDWVVADDMKFYIGGGWMTWHQEKEIGTDSTKAIDWYLNYLKTFKNVSGFYFEPAGEAWQSANWRMECESLRKLIRKVLKERPDFEVAIAIGSRNNTREYWELMSELDPKRVFWWWCWGDPHADNPWQFHPNILEWHMHWLPSNVAPHSSAAEAKMRGFATSYDVWMGFGNSWNGTKAVGGTSTARNFDPYTLPYFSQEYRFRERCWNTRMTDDTFASRLARRLFDANAPKESVDNYQKLVKFCWTPTLANAATIKALDEFVTANADRGTPRNRDTFKRMAEAVAGLKQTNAKADDGKK